MSTEDPPFGNPTDPGNSLPKPWEKPQEEEDPPEDGGPYGIDASVTGDVIDTGVQGSLLGAEVLNGAANVAPSAIEGAAEVAGAAIEGAGSALEAVGGLAEGCGGCALAVLVTLFAAAGSAMALFR